MEELLIARAAAIARKDKFDATEVRAMFARGTLGMRVLALGLMEGDPALADGPPVQEAIADPRSANEQYHGMELARKCWARLRPATGPSYLGPPVTFPVVAAMCQRSGVAQAVDRRLGFT